jgi:hypothetical protein
MDNEVEGENVRLSERLYILEMIDSGTITAEEGLRLLHALPEDEDEDVAMEMQPYATEPVEGGFFPADIAPESGPAMILPEQPAVQGVDGVASTQEGIPSDERGSAEGPVLSGEAIPASTPPDFTRWRQFWMVPLWAGVGVAVLGAILMYQVQLAAGVSFWFLCAAVPFTFGVILMTLAWQSRTARWLHLRVQHAGEGWPREFAFSFPLPLGIAGWAMRTFGVHIPGLETTSVDELMQIIQTSTSPDNPLYVEVEDEEDGEKVQIYIG